MFKTWDVKLQQKESNGNGNENENTWSYFLPTCSEVGSVHPRLSSSALNERKNKLSPHCRLASKCAQEVGWDSFALEDTKAKSGKLEGVLIEQFSNDCPKLLRECDCSVWWLANQSRASFSVNVRQTQNQSQFVSAIFSRALSTLQVIARNSDRLIALFHLLWFVGVIPNLV